MNVMRVSCFFSALLFPFSETQVPPIQATYYLNSIYVSFG